MSENNSKNAVFNPIDNIELKANVHTNLEQDIICTTRDRLELELRDFYEAIKSSQSLITYGSLSFSFLLSLVTSNFVDFILPAYVWHSIFIVSFIVCLLLTAKSYFNCKKSKENCDIKVICSKIMNKKP